MGSFSQFGVSVIRYKVRKYAAAEHLTLHLRRSPKELMMEV